MTSWERLALMNYGHFTTMRVERGRVRGLAGHLTRLAHDSRALFGTELDTGLVRAVIRDAVGATAGPLTVRVTVFDPDLPLDRPAAPARPRPVVTTRAAVAGPLPALRLRSAEYVRDRPGVKHTGLFGALHQRRAAQTAGYDDAVFAGPDGLISEGPTWNVAWLAGETLVLPSAPALPGVTLGLLAAAFGGPVRTEAVSRHDLTGFDAAFVTNAAVGVRPVSSLDSTRWPVGHEGLRSLIKAYEAVPPESI
ncbi:aminotransferase class IV [Actinoplanes sp. NPDC051494]|uniref:aminotransferase class IV n=1 Tax=Actinoplanes sp. NPDC051494 TaxID=3363907 RepID=UPI00378F9AAA